MGWPIGWTSLAPMSQESFMEWKSKVLGGEWWDIDPATVPESAEGYIPRVKRINAYKSERLRALGNGQVPLTAAVAEEILRSL